jgi:hypothetical protein
VDSDRSLRMQVVHDGIISSPHDEIPRSSRHPLGSVPLVRVTYPSALPNCPSFPKTEWTSSSDANPGEAVLRAESKTKQNESPVPWLWKEVD